MSDRALRIGLPIVVLAVGVLCLASGRAGLRHSAVRAARSRVWC